MVNARIYIEPLGCLKQVRNLEGPQRLYKGIWVAQGTGSREGPELRGWLGAASWPGKAKPLSRAFPYEVRRVPEV